METVNTEEILTKYLGTFNRHDVDEIIALCSPDILHLHPFPGVVKGLEAVRKENEGFFRAFPDIRAEIVRLVTKGDWGAAELVLRGTQTGPLEISTGTVPPTNRSVEMKVAAFLRLDSEGLVSEEHYYFDTAGLMKQLGIKPES